MTASHTLCDMNDHSDRMHRSQNGLFMQEAQEPMAYSRPTRISLISRQRLSYLRKGRRPPSSSVSLQSLEVEEVLILHETFMALQRDSTRTRAITVSMNFFGSYNLFFSFLFLLSNLGSFTVVADSIVRYRGKQHPRFLYPRCYPIPGPHPCCKTQSRKRNPAGSYRA